MIYKNTKANIFQGDVYTFDYHISGNVNFPKKASSTEYLNRKHTTMVPINDSMVRKFNADTMSDPNKGYLFTASFMAIPKDRVLWIYGGNPSPKSSELAGVGDRSLIVLYHNFFVRGFMEIAERIRTTDYFSYRHNQGKHFAEMQQVTFGVAGSHELFVENKEQEVLDFITLNLQNATGVCEISSDH